MLAASSCLVSQPLLVSLPFPWADCEYDSATLSLFTSSLFLAAMAASLPASYVTRRLGRKASMVVGGLW